MNKIYVPDGMGGAAPAPPETSAIIMLTADGKQIAFPQVAVAVISPDVVNLIAEAVYQRLQNGAVMQPDGQFGIDMLAEAATSDLPNG
jgi:hypothetical protein